jgi:Predicted membrane protein (DUF2232)
MDRIAVPVLCGLVGAGLSLSVLIGSPGSVILVALTQLPLFLAGLWFGAGAAAVASLTALGVLLLSVGALSAAVYALVEALPVVVLVRQALLARTAAGGRLEWYSPGALTAWLTGFAFAGTVLGVVALGGPDTVEATLRSALQEDLSRIYGVAPGEAMTAAALLARIFPGLTAASWIVLTAVCGTLAQGLLTRFKANWRPTPDLAALDLPLWIPLLFAAAAAAAWLGGVAGYVGLNALVLLSVPLTLGGMAVLQVGARRLPRPAGPLTLFYVVAGLLGWPFLLLALLGLLDAPFGLKRRLLPPQSIGGEVDG